MQSVPAATDGSALAERVHRGLLRDIIIGDLAPRAWLKERDISEQYGVSRVPVRQALQRLEAEGFVVMTRNKGASVAEVARADVEELFDARLCIEPFATRRAAHRVHAGVASAQRLQEHLEHALAPTQALELGESNLAFHWEIVRLSGNRILERSVLPLLGRMQWIFGTTQSTLEQEHATEHQELFDSIVQGRGEVAAAQAHAHIEQAAQPIIEALAEKFGW